MADDDTPTQEAEHRLGVLQDRALARRRDESEIRGRSLEVFDIFVRMGFTVHLVAVQNRGAVEYRLALYPDGANSAIPSEILQKVAHEHNFDYMVERDPSYEAGWALVMYPLT